MLSLEVSVSMWRAHSGPRSSRVLIAWRCRATAWRPSMHTCEGLCAEAGLRAPQALKRVLQRQGSHSRMHVF